ncbi:sensor histidine kinase [Brachybacterium sp. AOP43-C2-M15]|uniref:sensor histidine kinase n=1 Tax=Brachybacterium sp. AOP43-C2-M15 TaxID=3457661 RepID=UPI004033C41D
METIRRQGRRFAWLMAGAAIGLAVVLLVVVFAVVLTRGGIAALAAVTWLLVPTCLLLGGALGLVPGVRELEVTGARSMLGADGELLVPRRPRPAHHLRTCAWVLLHLATGLLIAVLLLTFLPSAVLVIVENLAGRSMGSGVAVPADTVGRAAVIVLALLIGAVSAVLWWPTGALLARLAPHVLGPTTGDRLELAQQRVAREAERTRVARELHDGIGHALTIVSVQAAAARRLQHRDPQAVAQALEAIEATARGATGELDGMLALLRDEERSGAGADGRSKPRDRAAGRTPAPLADGRPAPLADGGMAPLADGGTAPLADLEQLLAAHRAAGMELRSRIALPEGLAELQRSQLLRCVSELLSNAHRHGASGPVDLALTSEDDRVRLLVRNALRPDGDGHDDDGPDGADPGGVGPDGAGHDDAGPDVDRRDGDEAPRATGGRGLAGLRERAELLGGTLRAGPDGRHWSASVDLPLLREGPPR